MKIDFSGEDFYKFDLRKANLAKINFFSSYFQEADLSDSNLSSSELDETSFVDANLCGAKLQKSSLYRSNLFNSNLIKTNFSNSDLSNAELTYTDCTEANFTSADLTWANLSGATLEKANFKKSRLQDTVIGLTDLSTCMGLDSVIVYGECIIDFFTLQVSRNLPRSFLLKLGLPELFIDYLPEFRDTTPIRMYPVFLSHSWQNKDFANKLYNALINRGVQVWYDEKKMKSGDDIYESLSRGIAVYDKMILVCSQQSLTESWWVDREIGRILEKERKLLKEKGKKVKLLIPIKIDDHIHDWGGSKKTEILDLKIGDFRDWQDEMKFQKALDELVAALNVDRGEDAPTSFL